MRGVRAPDSMNRPGRAVSIVAASRVAGLESGNRSGGANDLGRQGRPIADASGDPRHDRELDRRRNGATRRCAGATYVTHKPTASNRFNKSDLHRLADDFRDGREALTQADPADTAELYQRPGSR
jgi:hypothetical protein